MRRVVPVGVVPVELTIPDLPVPLSPVPVDELPAGETTPPNLGFWLGALPAGTIAPPKEEPVPPTEDREPPRGAVEEGSPLAGAPTLEPEPGSCANTGATAKAVAPTVPIVYERSFKGCILMSPVVCLR